MDHRPARPDHAHARKADHAKVTPKRRKPGRQDDERGERNGGPRAKQAGAQGKKRRAPEAAAVATAERTEKPRPRVTRSEIGLEPRQGFRKPTRGSAGPQRSRKQKRR